MNRKAEQALVRKLNRKLKPRGLRICTWKSYRDLANLGDYWIKDVVRKKIVRKHVNLEQLDREHGSLF